MAWALVLGLMACGASDQSPAGLGGVDGDRGAGLVDPGGVGADETSNPDSDPEAGTPPGEGEGETEGPPQDPGPDPGEVCGPNGECPGGACEVRWGNFCRVPCRRDDECGAHALCDSFVDGQRACLIDCEGGDCPNGWLCSDPEERSVCLPDCRVLGCLDGASCDQDSGRCVTGPVCVDEVCNGLDDDCDEEVDEGVLNACGQCGRVPTEACNDLDDDCDGETDEGVLNACGQCGRTPEEVCNGLDDDCDGDTDERLLNACGACGDVPEEVCNGSDDDCDGQLDEGVLNACDACGDVPEEVCNGADDDCDGQMDEGVLNACDACGELPPDRCDGNDDDCDGLVDEDAACPIGQGCLDDGCVVLLGPAQPCERDEECSSDECWTEEEHDRPGGFCAQSCNRDLDCGDDGALCALTEEGDRVCQEACIWADPNCRAGWVCNFSPDFVDVCLPDCLATGCADDEVCDEFTGGCVPRRVRITLNQVFIAPGKPDGDAWDGFGSVPGGAQAAVRVALRSADPRLALLELFAEPAFVALADPDPYGTARLFGAGFDPEAEVVNLPFFQDAFHPQYEAAGWQCVAFGADDDLELSFSLFDDDLVNDDAIGTAIIETDDLRAALRDGGLHPVNLADQGNGSLLLAAISVSGDACQ